MRDDERNTRGGADAEQGDSSARPPALILVRAAASLAPGLRFGDEALVDPTDPDIQDMMRGLLLIPLPSYRQPPDGDIR